jgi:hypothetical protein
MHESLTVCSACGMSECHCDKIILAELLASLPEDTVIDEVLYAIMTTPFPTRVPAPAPAPAPAPRRPTSPIDDDEDLPF